MLLFVAYHVLGELGWWGWQWAWPLYMLTVLWGALWVGGGPWLLAQAARHRRSERKSRLLDAVRLAHAGCWLTSTALPLIAWVSWMLHAPALPVPPME